MKRDVELIRAILLKAEDVTADGRPPLRTSIDGYGDITVAKHIEMLEEAGYVEANILRTETHGAVSGTVERITWAGQIFLNAARSETVWRRSLTHLGEKAGSISLEMLQQTLIRVARGMLGI